MPCTPIYPPYPSAPAPLPIPGIGIPFAPVQLPIPNWKFPPVFPEMIDELLKKFKLGWPGFIDGIQATIDQKSNDILSTIMNILGMLSPFLSLYNMFQAVLNLIMCIIDVICAIPNPWATITAINKLITQCLPPFLNIFPFMALVAMIIAIILLIIALIEYVIAKVIQLIKDLVRNIIVLTRGLSLTDAEATAAAAMKIANLFCIIQGLFAIFSVISGIIAIINTLGGMDMPKICFGDSGNGCCTEDYCPKFISETDSGFTGSVGQITYLNACSPQTVSGQPINVAPLNFSRAESIQLINTDSAALYKFIDIVTAKGNGGTFWPGSQTFTTSSDPKQVPYTGSVKFDLDNSLMPSSDGINGVRTFIVTDVFVSSRPYAGVKQYDNNVNSDTTGTLTLTGGKVWVKSTVDSSDSFSLTGYDSYAGTIDSLLHQNPTSAYIDTAVIINNVKFEVMPNLGALSGYYQLIGYGCLPQLKQAANIVSMQIPDYVIPPIPDPPHACLQTSLDTFRANPTEAGAAVFQDEFQTCLLTYQALIETDLCYLIKSAINIYHSTFTLDPDLQFVNDPIKLKVTLNDVNNVDLSPNLPDTCVGDILNNLTAVVTLGTASPFQYSNGEVFTYINSSISGIGVAKVQYLGNYLKVVTVPAANDPGGSTSISDLQASYTFVGSMNTISGRDGEVRRDERDVVGV